MDTTTSPHREAIKIRPADISDVAAFRDLRLEHYSVTLKLLAQLMLNRRLNLIPYGLNKYGKQNSQSFFFHTRLGREVVGTADRTFIAR